VVTAKARRDIPLIMFPFMLDSVTVRVKVDVKRPATELLVPAVSGPGGIEEVAFQRPIYRLVRLYETNGSITCRYYATGAARSAVTWLGGVGGGFDSPARDLYDHLATHLLHGDVNSLRIRYRQPGDLDQCVEDALVGIEFLQQRGIQHIALVGHSFGGAVAIQAAAAWPGASAVATLACQSFGTSAADRIAPRPLLLVHGDQDNVLPPECSAYIYERALDPKELMILPGAGHCFEETVPELQDLLLRWLQRVLPRATTSAVA
jgi:pimeloyl-ACP methyl ester carboxylesterase